MINVINGLQTSQLNIILNQLFFKQKSPNQLIDSDFFYNNYLKH